MEENKIETKNNNVLWIIVVTLLILIVILLLVVIINNKENNENNNIVDNKENLVQNSIETTAFAINNDNYSATLVLFGNGHYTLNYGSYAAKSSYGTYSLNGDNLVLSQTIASGSDCRNWKESKIYNVKVNKNGEKIKEVIFDNTNFASDRYVLTQTEYSYKNYLSSILDLCADDTALKDVYYTDNLNTVITIYPIGTYAIYSNELTNGQVSVGTYTVDMDNHLVTFNEKLIGKNDGSYANSNNTYTIEHWNAGAVPGEMLNLNGKKLEITPYVYTDILRFYNDDKMKTSIMHKLFETKLFSTYNK